MTATNETSNQEIWSRCDGPVLMDAVALGKAIRARSISCVEVMTSYLDHIERLNPRVNAIVAFAMMMQSAYASTSWSNHLRLYGQASRAISTG